MNGYVLTYHSHHVVGEDYAHNDHAALAADLELVTDAGCEVVSLDTLVDNPLAETRNVDDQAEWPDNGTVLYSVESDTYAVPADGSGMPRLFAHRADSPVVLPAG